MPADTLDFVPDAPPQQASWLSDPDFHPDQPAAPSAPAQAPGETWGHGLAEYAKSFPRMIGQGVGVLSKSAGAVAGRLAGTGDTAEDVIASVYGGRQLPVERAVEKKEGLPGYAARAGLGLVETLPKIGLLAAVGPEAAPATMFSMAGLRSILPQAVAAGGLFGMDDQGNFHPKQAAIAALMMPVMGASGELVSSAIAKGINEGASKFLQNRLAQKFMGILGTQATLNAYMTAAESPELMAEYRQDPKVAKRHIADIVGQNLAFALLDVPHLGKEIPSHAEGFILDHAEKYAKAADKLFFDKLEIPGLEERKQAIKDEYDAAMAGHHRAFRGFDLEGAPALPTEPPEPPTPPAAPPAAPPEPPPAPAPAPVPPPAPPAAPPAGPAREPGPTELEYGAGGEMPRYRENWLAQFPAQERSQYDATRSGQQPSGEAPQLPRIPPREDIPPHSEQVRQGPSREPDDRRSVEPSPEVPPQAPAAVPPELDLSPEASQARIAWLSAIHPVGPGSGGTRWKAIENTYLAAKAASEALPGVPLKDIFGITLRNYQTKQVVDHFFVKRGDFPAFHMRTDLAAAYPAGQFIQEVSPGYPAYRPQKGEPSYAQWLAGKRPEGEPPAEAPPAAPPVEAAPPEPSPRPRGVISRAITALKKERDALIKRIKGFGKLRESKSKQTAQQQLEAVNEQISVLRGELSHTEKPTVATPDFRTLTDADGDLFTISEAAKLPAFLPPGQIVSRYRTLRRKIRDGTASAKERDQFRVLAERFPTNFEDDFGVNGEAMRRAYDAAKKAGIASQLFTVVTHAGNANFNDTFERVATALGKPGLSPKEIFAIIEKGATGIVEGKGAAAEVHPEQDFVEQISEAPGKISIFANHLRIGEKLVIGGEPFTVTHIDPDTYEVTITNGKRFGRQKLREHQEINVEEYTEHPREEPGFLTEADEAKAEPEAAREPGRTELEYAGGEMPRYSDKWVNPLPARPTPAPAAAPPKPPTRPAGPAVDLFGNPIEAPKPEAEPETPRPEQQGFGFAPGKPAAAPAPEPERRALTKAEQNEFQRLSIKLRDQREKDGPALTTEETQRYEHLAQLAGQESFGFRAEVQTIQGQIKVLVSQLKTLDDKRPQGRGKRFEAWAEQRRQLERQYNDLRDQLTEGQGEHIYTSPIKEMANGYFGRKEYRVRELSDSEIDERFRTPSAKMELYKSVGQRPWVAESRRLDYEDEAGTKLADKGHWYADLYGRTRDSTIAAARKKQVGKWHEIPEEALAPKPEGPELITDAAYQPEPGRHEYGPNHPAILERLGIKGFEKWDSRNTKQFGYRTNRRPFIDRDEARSVAEKAGQNLVEFEPGEQVHSNQVASPNDPNKPLSEEKPPFQRAPDEEPLPPDTDFVALMKAAKTADEGRKILDQFAATFNAIERSLGLTPIIGRVDENFYVGANTLSPNQTRKRVKEALKIDKVKGAQLDRLEKQISEIELAWRPIRDRELDKHRIDNRKRLKTEPPPAEPPFIDEDVVHNWDAKYIQDTWASKLSDPQKADLQAAMVEHHQKGTSARQLAAAFNTKWYGRPSQAERGLKFKEGDRVWAGQEPMHREGTIVAFGPFRDGVQEYFVRTNLGEVSYKETDLRPFEEPQPTPPPAAPKPEPAPEAKPQFAPGGAPDGSIVNGFKKQNGRWYKIREEGDLHKIPTNTKQHTQLEAAFAAGPPPEDPRTPEQILGQARVVEVKVPPGATQIRITTSTGGTSTQSLKSVEHTRGNPFNGVSIRKIEAGSIGKDGKFRPIEGRVTVTDVGKRRAALPQSLIDQISRRAVVMGPNIVLETTADIHKAINDPKSNITQGHRLILDKLLGTGILDRLPGLKFEITDYIAGGSERGGPVGEFLPGRDLVRFLRWSDADVPLHEFSHFVYEHLRPEDREFIRQFRRETINRDAPQTGADFMRGLDSDEFVRRGLSIDLYHLANDSEFFAWLLTNEAKKTFSQAAPVNFFQRIGRLIRDLYNSFKDAVGLSPREEAMWRQMLSGDYQYSANDGIKFGKDLNRRAALARTAEQYEKEQEFATTPEVRRAVPVRTVGAYGDLARLKLEQAERLNLSDRARALLDLPRHVEMFARGFGESQGIDGYVAARQAVRDMSPHIRWAVTQDALHNLGFEQKRSIGLRTRFEEKRAYIDSPTFQTRLARLAERELINTVRRQKEETYRNVVANKAAEFLSELERSKVTDARTDELRQDLAQARKLLDYARAVGEEMDHIVSRVYRNYWEFGRPSKSGKVFADLYLAMMAREGNPVTDPQRLALVRLASETLAINSNLTEKLVWMERMRREPDFAAAVNDLGAAFARRLQRNPADAIREMVTKEGKLAASAADARRAFLSLNREVMRHLEEFSDLESAVSADDAIKQHPQWRSLVNLVHRDADAVYIPDDIKAKVKNGNVFNEFTSVQNRIDPRGINHTIDLSFGGTWNRAYARDEQVKVEAYLNAIDDWLNDPFVPADHPDRPYWLSEKDWVDAVYNTNNVFDPSSAKSLIGFNPWTMPEFFFRQAVLPALKVVQRAFENWDRSWIMGQQWSMETEAPLMRAIKKAINAHNAEAKQLTVQQKGRLGYWSTRKPFEGSNFREYGERILDPLAWEYRHGNAVKAGDTLFRHKILAEDLEVLRLMGRSVNSLLTRSKNLGARRVMQEDRLFDEWAQGVFAVRKPQEFGAEPGTTVPREFSNRIRVLAKTVAKAMARPNFYYTDLIELFNQEPYFEPFVMRWLKQRSADYSKLSPYEDLYREIYRKWNANEEDAPRTVDEIAHFIDANTDDTHTLDAIGSEFIGSMAAELNSFHERFLKDPDPASGASDVRVIRATQDGPFTKGFQKDVGSSFYYNYGMISAPEVRSVAIDGSMYHLRRLSVSLADAIQHLDLALSDYTRVKDNPRLRKELLAFQRKELKYGAQFRDYETLELQRKFLKYLHDNLDIFSHRGSSALEMLNNLGRFVAAPINWSLGGVRTISHVFTGSMAKQGMVLRAFERSYLTSYAKAAVSMAISGARIALGGPAAIIGRRLGLMKQFEGNLSGLAEEMFRFGHFFNLQEKYGLMTKNPTWLNLVNNWTMPYTHGRGYDPRLSERWWLRIPQKAFYRAWVAGVETPAELLRTLFPALGYSIAYDSVARQINWGVRGLEEQARKTFDYLQKTGDLRRFDLNNPKSANNRLLPEYVLPRGLGPRNNNHLVQVREVFNRATDIDLADQVFTFWKRLSETPREQWGNVLLLGADAATPEAAAKLHEERMGALATIGLKDIHHASPANRPWALRASNALRTLFPIAGWNTQSLRQIFMLLGRAQQDPALSQAMLTAMTTIGGLSAMAYLWAAGDAEKRAIEKIMWLANHQVEPTRHQGQGRDKAEEAAIAVSNVTGYLNMVNGIVNRVLDLQGGRGQFGVQFFIPERINSLTDYVSGVVHTHDPAYGFAAFMGREMPLSKVLVNRLPSSEGIIAQRNARTLIQRFAPQELMRQSQGGYGIATPTELSPIKADLVNAIYKGDAMGVQEAYNRFVVKAGQLGRPDPEKLAAAVIRSLNPYSIALIGHPSEAQRDQLLSRLSPDEKQMVLDAEQHYLSAANSVGVQSQMVRQDRGAGGGTVSGPGGLGAGASGASSRGGGVGGGGGGGLAASAGLGGASRSVSALRRVARGRLGRGIGTRRVHGRLRIRKLRAPRLAATTRKRRRLTYKA